jgi:hypothetical protein
MALCAGKRAGSDRAARTAVFGWFDMAVSGMLVSFIGCERKLNWYHIVQRSLRSVSSCSGMVFYTFVKLCTKYERDNRTSSHNMT